MKKYIPFVAFLSTLYHDQAYGAQRRGFHQSCAQVTMSQKLAEELSSQEDFIYFPEHVDVHPFSEIVKSTRLFHDFIKGAALYDDKNKNVANTISYSSYLPFLNPNKGWIDPLTSVLLSMTGDRARFDIISSIMQIFLRQSKPKEIEILSKIYSKMKQQSTKNIDFSIKITVFYDFIWEEKLLILFEKNIRDIRETDDYLFMQKLHTALNKTFKAALHAYKPLPRKTVIMNSLDFFPPYDIRGERFYGRLSADAKNEITRLINDIFSNFELPESYIKLMQNGFIIQHNIGLLFGSLFKVVNSETSLLLEKEVMSLLNAINNYVKEYSLYDSLLALNAMSSVSEIKLPLGYKLPIEDTFMYLQMIFEKKLGLAQINYLIYNLKKLSPYNNDISNEEISKKILEELFQTDDSLKEIEVKAFHDEIAAEVAAEVAEEFSQARTPLEVADSMPKKKPIAAAYHPQMQQQTRMAAACPLQMQQQTRIGAACPLQMQQQTRIGAAYYPQMQQQSHMGAACPPQMQQQRAEASTPLERAIREMAADSIAQIQQQTRIGAAYYPQMQQQSHMGAAYYPQMQQQSQMGAAYYPQMQQQSQMQQPWDGSAYDPQMQQLSLDLFTILGK